MFIAYKKSTGKISFDEKGFDVYENNMYLLLYQGLINHLAVEDILATNRIKKCGFEEYTILIYDKKEKNLIVQQNSLGGKCWIYLIDTLEKIYIASSLKELKDDVNEKFVFNEEILPHFLYNGFIYGKDTLIKGVFKIIPGQSIKITQNEIIQIQDPADYYNVYDNTMLENLYMDISQRSIEQILKKQLDKDSNVNVALSSGYDSNYILYNAIKTVDNFRIKTYSVGGVKGYDETYVAEKISSRYKIDFKKSYVTTRTLENIELIVQALEGSVYECGIFLQYELACLLKNSGAKSIMCGECADQIFNINFYKNIPENNFLYDYKNHPFQMATYVVKKKSQMMMNFFDIDALYPFITDEMIMLGYALRENNGETKEFHKEMCHKILPKDIGSMLKKKGGTTSLSALFDDTFEPMNVAEKLPYYQEDYIITQKYSRDEAEKDYYLTLLYLSVFKKIFCD